MPAKTPLDITSLGRSSHGLLAGKASLRHRHPYAVVGVLGRTAVVDLAVAVGYDDQAQQVARQIQRHVASALRDQIGLRDVRVNVSIDDALDGDDAG